MHHTEVVLSLNCTDQLYIQKLISFRLASIYIVNHVEFKFACDNILSHLEWCELSPMYHVKMVKENSLSSDLSMQALAQS